MDARLYIDGWCTPEFDDSSWPNALLADTPKGTILPCTVNPITVRYELKPVSIKEQKDICYLKTAFKNGTDIPSTKISGYLYDFGQSCAGICKLTIKGEPGQKITLRHGERLADDGGFNINSIYTFKNDYADYIHLFQTDVFTLKGNETEIFIPPFTYHGFRYVFVEGITEKQATKELLTFEILSSDIKQRGTFSCSDDTVNTLYKMGIHADLSNFHYFPTDCPHREKNGWTGDASVSAEQLLLSFDCSEEFKVWLRTLGYAQKPDGSLPGIAPTGGWGFAWGNGPMWDSACVNLPYYVYKYDGRTDILKESSDTIFRYLKYVASRRNENGLIAIGLGDWCQPRKRGEPIAAPLVLTDSAISYDIAVKSALIFDVIGDMDRCVYATSLAAELKTAIQKHLIDHTTMTASGSCQTSQALLLALGLFDQNEVEVAYKRLIALTEEKDGHAVCGMIGLRYIFEVLARGGDIDLALRMICRNDEPSYGSMIQRGATALCEALMENGLNESENHHFLGDILRIFQSYIAGLHINPNMRDINEIVFAPIIPSMLNEANGSYRFQSGICKFGWKKNDTGIASYITVPENVHGHFIYKEKTIELKEGENSFLIQK
jgi:alpha-L-rhamnosidase